jgi:hypothetical protein
MLKRVATEAKEKQRAEATARPKWARHEAVAALQDKHAVAAGE